MLKYRTEIDGLRALAVLPVILFHAGFETFAGGYVGVDVFFVISGYLITSILMMDLDRGTFSIGHFYERRARRILPALYFMLTVVCVLAVALMLPSQLRSFGQSLVSAVLFVSNIFFFLQIDYWAEASEFLPLLHTWSLGLEEQYYIIFPLFLWGTWKFGKRKVYWMIVLTAVLSLALSEWGWRRDAAANFYLFPTRAWEIFAGSMVAFVAQQHGIRRNEWLSMVGLALIVFSIFAFDRTTPFPSLYTLVPIVGVALLILFGEAETRAARALSHPWLVKIGLLSYSAYLWHQPIFALRRIQTFEKELSLGFAFAGILGTFALAYFSYTYVERPFRARDWLTRKQIFGLSAAPLALFSILGIYLHFSDGMREMKMMGYEPATREALESLEQAKLERAKQWKDALKSTSQFGPEDGRERLLFMGDSISEDLTVAATQSPALSARYDIGRIVFDDECAAFIATKGNQKGHDGTLCKDAFESFLRSSLVEQADLVVIAALWKPSNASALEDLLELPVLEEKRLLVYKTHFFSNISSLIMGREEMDIPFTASAFEKFVYWNRHNPTVQSHHILDEIAERRAAVTLSGFDAFCSDTQQGCTLFSETGIPYLIDSAHLSVSGMERFEVWLSEAVLQSLP